MDGRYLNEVAQARRPMEQALDTFTASPIQERSRALSLLAFMAHQASAEAADVDDAIAAEGMGPDFKPIWKPTPGIYFGLTDGSADPQQFRYLMRLFSIADSRRRKVCAGKCSHWWHHLDE
jgi:hypothetical protein